jgi:hypothetical protein
MRGSSLQQHTASNNRGENSQSRKLLIKKKKIARLSLSFSAVFYVFGGIVLALESFSTFLGWALLFHDVTADYFHFKTQPPCFNTDNFFVAVVFLCRAHMRILRKKKQPAEWNRVDESRGGEGKV